MSNLTYDIATILSVNGFGTIGLNIFVGDDGLSFDQAIIIRSFGTSQSDFPTIDLAYPLVEIIVRTTKGTHQQCETTVYAIKDFMKTIANYTINTSIYVNINHQNGPTYIGLDPKMRPEYSLILSCLKTST